MKTKLSLPLTAAALLLQRAAVCPDDRVSRIPRTSTTRSRCSRRTPRTMFRHRTRPPAASVSTPAPSTPSSTSAYRNMPRHPTRPPPVNPGPGAVGDPDSQIVTYVPIGPNELPIGVQTQRHAATAHLHRDHRCKAPALPRNSPPTSPATAWSCFPPAASSTAASPTSTAAAASAVPPPSGSSPSPSACPTAPSIPCTPTSPTSTTSRPHTSIPKAPSSAIPIPARLPLPSASPPPAP